MPSNPKVITVTGLSTTAGFDVFVTDQTVSPFNLGLGATSSGNTYTVEHTFNDLGPTSTRVATGATWFSHSTMAAQSTNSNGNYAFPVSAIRLNVTAGSSTGTTTLTILSAG